MLKFLLFTSNSIERQNVIGESVNKAELEMTQKRCDNHTWNLGKILIHS